MRLFAALAVTALLSSVASHAQAPAPATAPAGPTVGFMHAIHATSNVETTLAFYTKVFGVTTNVAPFANAAVPILTDSPGVSLRVAMLRLPGDGMNFELTEFTGVPRTPKTPRVTDPGAPHMKFLVRDIDTVVANARAANATVVTRSGAPVTAQTAIGSARSIILRDPDGYIVQVIQSSGPVLAPPPAPRGGGAAAAAPPAPAAPSNVVGAIMGETIGDMAKSMKFWKDQMGWDVQGDSKWIRDKAVADLWGVAESTEFRVFSAVVPGSKTAQLPTGARMEFIEFKDAPKTPYDMRVPDPGSSGMAIRVADIANLLTGLKGQGVRVISRNGELVEWSATVRNAFIKDPDGLNIEIVGDIGPARGAAPPTTPPAPGRQ
jgi:catechol 2,3-dioxygenase-like lactoylglutathione lyase family enzyme